MVLLFRGWQYETHCTFARIVSDYRIDLSDGSYRVVESDANDDTKIHVVSDDDIYIIQSEMNFLFQAHRQVYFFDCGTGSKEKLIII